MTKKLICYLILQLVFVILMGAHVHGQPLYMDQKTFLDGKKKVTIPFKYVHNFIILQVKLYGVLPVNLIYDTGAEHVIIFKRAYTDALQVPYDKRIPIMGADLSRKIFALITRNAMLELQGLSPKPYDMLVLEEDYFQLDELVGYPIDGLIGGGFFKNLIVNIDYRNNRMTLHDPANFEIPNGFVMLPIRVKTNKPYINAETSLQDGTVVEVDLLIDTGAGVPLLLHTNSAATLKLPDRYIRGKLGMGLGGYLEGFIGRVNMLKIGELEFPGVLTSFQEISELWLADQDRFRNGILGNQLLNRFSVYFDYIHSQIYLKAYHKKQMPFSMDRSGLIIFAFSDDFNQFVVKDVIQNSPAEEADIRPEDIIAKIQGFPTHFYTLEEINGMLQKKVGKKVKLVIKRDGRKLRKELLLRDLI
ncbi:MAG TPA: aspartyl protease family protein [Saprospiraceae bacterium]|nr:aspartyl protease family protein [Saprospiraceae bacterium]